MLWENLGDLEAEGNFIVGFLDECSPQTDANTVRRWAFEKPVGFEGDD